MGIAIWPSGAPFQATVRPLENVITASNGPALVMAPVRPVMNAGGAEGSTMLHVRTSHIRTFIGRIRDDDRGDAKDRLVYNLLHDWPREDRKEKLRKEGE